MDQRRQLVRVARDPGADPAEIALRVQAFHERDLDVATMLLRVDALADVVRTSPVPEGPLESSAADVVHRLQWVLGDQLGYRGDPARPRTHRDAFLADTLDGRHGLPVTLSTLWAAVAQRLGVPAFVVNLPGHVVAAVGDGDGVRAIDAFRGGAPLTEAQLGELVERATAGRLAFRRSMLRPAAPADIARRFLHNLTVDLRREGPPDGAIWTVVARLALPEPDPGDHRLLGDLLAASGRFVRAAQAYDRWRDVAPDSATSDEAARLARGARARLN